MNHQTNISLRWIIIILMLPWGILAFSQEVKVSGPKRQQTAQTQTYNVSGTINDHDYVDLGLPSGIKWATCNLGAKTPSARGNYYAWGETRPKASYTLDNYFDEVEKRTMYGDIYFKTLSYDKINGQISPSSGYDAARENWGNPWRMPTIQEYKELFDHCKVSSKTINGTAVLILKGPSGKSIYLPIVGYKKDKSIESKEFGMYWSASMNEILKTQPEGIAFYWRGLSGGHSTRYDGLTIRAVCE